LQPKINLSIMSATQMRTALLQNLSQCDYTIAEAQQRVEAAAARVMAGDHGKSNADFKSQVRSWYK